jgi:hypothetical protein
VLARRSFSEGGSIGAVVLRITALLLYPIGPLTETLSASDPGLAGPVIARSRPQRFPLSWSALGRVLRWREKNMKHIGFAALIVVGLSTHLIGQQPVAVSADKDDKVTLVGCVIKGDGGYVLSSVNGWESPSAGAASATVASASTVAGRTFYWLKDDDDLEKHAGRKVEVVGKLDDEIDQGKIKVEREDGMAKIEFQADGESKVTIKAPESLTAVGTSGTLPDRDKTHRVTIRKIDVKSVKVVASTCQ